MPQVSATLIFALSVVGDMRQGIGSTEFDEVSSNLYAVLAYLAIGCGGLWAFFRAHDVPLSVAEVRLKQIQKLAHAPSGELHSEVCKVGFFMTYSSPWILSHVKSNISMSTINTSTEKDT